MTIDYTYYQFDGWYIGYLDDYPDHQTQGQTRAELEEMLLSLRDDIASGTIPFIRHKAQIAVGA
jgi:hypothetical protein